MINLEPSACADNTLTEEQRRIVEAPPAARLLITAGPGTGKTHVLVERLVVLIVLHRLRPGDEILVL
jgi:superfamily I DNA/RNA helicase